MKTIQFGYHLTLDFYGCDKSQLNSMRNCYNALEGLVDVLGMKPLIPPLIIAADGNQDHGGKDPGGYSGFIIIAESHISLHTFVKRGFVSIDVYSCKIFDKNKAIEYFKEAFSPKDIEMNFVNRGTRYPAENIY